jgi:hypothetical protein
VKLRWRSIGGQAGLAVGILGFLLIFLGWNGAATYDRVPAQFPYLISGGIAGLSLVVIAGALVVVNAQRQDRAALLNGLAELKEAVERMSLATAGGVGGGGESAAATLARLEAAEREGLVVAGPTTYHRPTCRLLEGRGVLPTVTVDVAVERGLDPCRACDAAELALPVAERATTGGRRRRSTRA